MQDSELAAERREEELQVLESIYPDYIVQRTEDALRLEIPVELGEQKTVELESEASSSDLSSKRTVEVSYLPSLLLDICLTAPYPLDSAPAIRSIHATHFWLTPTQTALLADELHRFWTHGEGVLCEWVEAIRSGEFMQKLGIVDALNNIRISCPAPHVLEPLLKDFDESRSTLLFSNTSFPCSICFSSLKGVRCVLLHCKHVFCRECLQDCWGLHIKEGSVQYVTCPEPSCVKANRDASEEELRRVVSDEEVRRWKWLKVKAAMEKDPSLLHCPVPTCQAPVPKPPVDEGQSSGWDRFRHCDACSYDFCSFCKRTWHGPITECPESVTISLVERYLALPEGSSARENLERKFGAGVVAKLCRAYQNEKLTKALLEKSTTACPGCNVRVEKSEGCNHMTCRKCSKHFCYRCGEVLDPANPYLHFNTIRSKCNGQLFDRIEEHTMFEMFHEPFF